MAARHRRGEIFLWLASLSVPAARKIWCIIPKGCTEAKHDGIQPNPWCLKVKYYPDWSCDVFTGHLATVLCCIEHLSWWNHNGKHIWVTFSSPNCWLAWRCDGLWLVWCPPCKSDILNFGCVALFWHYSDQLISLESYVFHIFICSLVWGERLFQHGLDKPE